MNKRNKIKSFIDSLGGQIFSITWAKKDGTLTTRTCRNGVTKDLKGGANTTAHLEQYFTLYDTNKAKALKATDSEKKAWVNVNLDTVSLVKCGGLELNVAQAGEG